MTEASRTILIAALSVAAGMTWQPGWEYVLPAGWTVTDKVAQPDSRMRFDE